MQSDQQDDPARWSLSCNWVPNIRLPAHLSHLQGDGVPSHHVPARPEEAPKLRPPRLRAFTAPAEPGATIKNSPKSPKREPIFKRAISEAIAAKECNQSAARCTPYIHNNPWINKRENNQRHLHYLKTLKCIKREWRTRRWLVTSLPIETNAKGNWSVESRLDLLVWIERIRVLAAWVRV